MKIKSLEDLTTLIDTDSNNVKSNLLDNLTNLLDENSNSEVKNKLLGTLITYIGQDSNEQNENNLLENLINLLEQDSAGVEGHSGSKGQDIDVLFSGPFHPDFGSLKDTLKLQLKQKHLIVKWNNEVTPVFDKLYKIIPEFEKAIEDAVTDYGNPYRDFKPVYDKVVKMSDKEINNLKNNTDKFKPVSMMSNFI